MLENGYLMQIDDRQYRILEQLGRGANSVAYLAECSHDGLTTKCILKEFSPSDTDDFARKKERFLSSGRMQNDIRQRSVLTNQTPPVSHIFEANGTAFVDVACFGGTTLDKLIALTLPQYMAICRTIAKTVSYYHQAGLLCLDLKPENIFILQNAPDDTLTQIVEFIDFDSVRDVSQDRNTVFSYTREWAAAEQLNPYEVSRIGVTADIYTVGEIVFYLLFGRHSTEQEHRGFSKYPFEKCKREYHRFADRPDVQGLFARLFRGTIRSSPLNRFQDMGTVVALLDSLVDVLQQKDYVIPKLPSVSPHFVGREAEMKQIADALKSNPVLFVTGIGGIGKSTLVRNYIVRNKTEYDVIAYLEFDGDIRHTFCDDMQLQISTISRINGEGIDEYFSRKLSHFKQLCGEKRVLFIVDNFIGKITKDLSRILECGYDTMIVTRNQPPKNSFAFLEVGAISDSNELFRLIVLNLDRRMTQEERLCFEEIIALVQGHTLVIELIARQIAAGKLGIQKALELIRENGFSRFSSEKIGNYKDGEEVYDTLAAMISALFRASGMSGDEILMLKVLAMLDVRGLEMSRIRDITKLSIECVPALCKEGWLYADSRIWLHPVIAETVRNWDWSAKNSDIDVMQYHKRMIDIYVGMANHGHIFEILREAERYAEQHSRHFIRAMLYDMQGCYYDTLLGGAYDSDTADDAELQQKLMDTMENAIAEMELSNDLKKPQFLAQYYLSMASIMLRSTPNRYHAAASYIKQAKQLIESHEPEYSENRCYLCTVSAWYYTVAKPDIRRVKALARQAEIIARKVFPTELEIIDIIHIPMADCLSCLDDPVGSAQKLEEAIAICRKNSDSLPYIDKLTELLNCLLDVHMQMRNFPRCRKLVAEIQDLNKNFQEQGICREVNPDILKILAI
ncbi:MAG: serine/threonine protein kinase [Oscillospiraceae bacterium]|nr:serine/threonine protein kinase [Oscillospiraceae bacterium]